MKKLLLIGLLVGSATTVFADKFIEARIGMNAFGTYNSSNSDAITKYKTSNVGVDFAGEFLASVDEEENFYLGAGIAYQNNQPSKAKGDPMFKSIPVYGALKYYVGTLGDSDWETYLKANLGYSFNSKDGYDRNPDDGLYYALGGGIEHDGVILEVAYQTTYGKTPINDHDDINNYSRWTFGIGYRFSGM